MTTPENITELKDNEIFVFGSNEAGIHGSGAAKTARTLFGARYGIGEGRTGQCYAIPTKDISIKTLALEAIKIYVGNFLRYAENTRSHRYLVTLIGCGYAGYTPWHIGPLFFASVTSRKEFEERYPNVILPKEFWEFSGNH